MEQIVFIIDSQIQVTRFKKDIWNPLLTHFTLPKSDDRTFANCRSPFSCFSQPTNCASHSNRTSSTINITNYEITTREWYISAVLNRKQKNSAALTSTCKHPQPWPCHSPCTPKFQLPFSSQHTVKTYKIFQYIHLVSRIFNRTKQ